MAELPKIPLITYNLKDRGRQYRGTPRNFNIKALCDSINGPACQERVKTRAMLGYYGHKPRILAGLEPTESVVVNGKYNEIEPAIVTTYLEASLDGTIKHQTEFLDTAAGRKAAAMFSNRIGGFSSAIDENRPELFGFDYVLDPNFSGNRGFSLDSAGITFDQVAEEARSEEEEFLRRLIETKNAEINQLKVALDSLSIENEDLSGMLLKARATLDSVDAQLPLVVALDSTRQLQNSIESFRREAVLPGFTQSVTTEQEKAQSGYEKTLAMMGIKRV